MIIPSRILSSCHAGAAALLRIAAGLAIVAASGQATLADAPLTVTVLPPAQVVASQEMIDSVYLFSDQLAAELARDAELSVVDRTQIDRILMERAIGKVASPALAYDGMIRVSIDPLHDKPELIVEVVDLSSGNLGGSHAYPWTAEVPADRLREIALACKASLRKAVASAHGKVKLRLLGVSTPSGMDRLQPMREHLQQMVEQVVAQNPQVCVVQHLEALTAKEESLLLLMGHTQLAGGREFAPHADRLLAVELAETDARGKTFDDTTIELRFRLGTDGASGDWHPVRGKVAEWPKLAPQACQLLAEQLGQARPGMAADFVTEMITRRRQAEAELAAALPPMGSRKMPDLPRLAAAAKLDPTYEEAAFRIILAKWPGTQFSHEGAPDVVQFLERFPSSKNRKMVMTSLTAYRGDHPPQDLVQTELNKRIIDLGMSADIHDYVSNCGFLVVPTYRGWLANGGDRTQCNEWLEQVRQRVEILIPQLAGFNDTHSRASVEASFLRVRSVLVAAAFESGDENLSRQRLKEYMTCGRWIAKHAETAKTVRETVVQMADPELLTEFDRWLKERTTPIEQIQLTWDDYPVYEGDRQFEKIQEFSPMLPLVAGPSALYGVSGAALVELSQRENQPSRQKLVRIPIDAEGAPSGKPAPMTLPPLNSDLAVTGATFQAGILYVSTKRTGLLTYDVAAERWQQISPKEGLPDWYVAGVRPVDDKTLLIVAGDPATGRVSFSTFDTETKQIKLVGRLDHNSSELSAPIGIWRQGEQVSGITKWGLLSDILGSPRLDLKWPRTQPYGWPAPVNRFTGTAVVGGKRYVMCAHALHEIDDNGKLVLSWFSRASIPAGSRKPFDSSQDFVVTPGDFPTDRPQSGHLSVHTFIAESKGHLFLIGPIAGIVCYEPTSDTWFGPLSPRHGFAPECLLGTAGGVWSGGEQGFGYLRTDDFVAAAQAAGRVMTTEKIRLRKRKLANQAGPLAAARFDVSLRSFDSASRRAQAVLADRPDDPQALLLLAVLNDWCRNRPEEAIAWYRRLAASKSDLSAIYTGLYGEFKIHYALGHWDQAIETGERLLDEVPCLGGRRALGGTANTIESCIITARKNRDRRLEKNKP